MPLLTVGHGRLTAAEFADLLTGAGVGLLIDVRRQPGSRRHPHFGREPMRQWLADAGVAYRWEEDLGGRRPVPDDSPDSALPAALRGYAAHLRGAACASALDRVLAAARRHDHVPTPSARVERGALVYDRGAEAPLPGV